MHHHLQGTPGHKQTGVFILSNEDALHTHTHTVVFGWSEQHVNEKKVKLMWQQCLYSAKVAY